MSDFPILSLTTFLASTILGSVLSLILGVIDRTGGLVLKLCRVWSAVVLGVPGVKVEVKMHAPLDPKRPYVFMANHASMVDSTRVTTYNAERNAEKRAPFTARGPRGAGPRGGA